MGVSQLGAKFRSVPTLQTITFPHSKHTTTLGQLRMYAEDRFVTVLMF